MSRGSGTESAESLDGRVPASDAILCCGTGNDCGESENCCAVMAGANLTNKGTPLTPVSAEMQVPLPAMSGTIGTHLKIKLKATKGRVGPIQEVRRTGIGGYIKQRRRYFPSCMGRVGSSELGEDIQCPVQVDDNLGGFFLK